MTDAVERGRQAFASRAWGEAYALLASEECDEAQDVERLAVAAHLTGRDDDSARAWERAQVEFERAGDLPSAARCAFSLGLSLLMRGQPAHAGGWLARAERLADRADRVCAAKGFVLLPEFLEALWGGAPSRANELASQIIAIAEQCRDPELLAFGVFCRGEALLSLGDTRAGMKLLDEAMVSVTTGEVSPIPAGILYCAVIEACFDVFDMRRAAEWTDALDQWCGTQPDLVPYRGQCLVHRAQVLQARGEWTEAATVAERARQRLAVDAHPALGNALYQLGELHRMRGELAAADAMYRAAAERGREPAPGSALLRLAEGKVDAAVSAVERMVDETRGLRTQPAMLSAAVEVLLAAGDVDRARAARDELAERTDPSSAPLVHAIVAHATGSVLLAAGDAPSALAELRAACSRWLELGMPYEAARTRVQIALACRAMDDDDAGDRELEAAAAAFGRLGAAPDASRVAALSRRGARVGGLTSRECEVLRVVATGVTNRDVAAALGISEHTVARHLQNIFVKLGLSSRAAATAYAHAHGLV